jgi:hypothetical protein
MAPLCSLPTRMPPPPPPPPPPPGGGGGGGRGGGPNDRRGVVVELTQTIALEGRGCESHHALDHWSELQLTPHPHDPSPLDITPKLICRPLCRRPVHAPLAAYAAADASASTALPCPALVAAPAGAGGCHLRRNLGVTGTLVLAWCTHSVRSLASCEHHPPPHASPRHAAAPTSLGGVLGAVGQGCGAGHGGGGPRLHRHAGQYLLRDGRTGAGRR